LLLAALSESYTAFLLALVALTVIVGAGLNILYGLSGQISLGHIGFYAIGAYTVGILSLKGIGLWLSLPAAAAVAGAIGLLLALPALRVAGPYLAMVTIAFAFVIQHGAVEWRGITGGANGLSGIAATVGSRMIEERELAMFAIALSGLSLWLFHRIARSAWGQSMLAVRDSEVAARSLGIDPVVLKTAAFALSAAFTGVAGGLFAPLMTFLAPDSFPLSQSILFLLAVIVGGSGYTLGPVIGAAVVVVMPELLAGLAEYRLLFFSGLLLIVLWIAPSGVIGAFRRLLPKSSPSGLATGKTDIAAFLHVPSGSSLLTISKLGISFGGVKAVNDVTFAARPGQVTSVIGPNGAGKTTVLNMIGGLYVPAAGRITLANQELAGLPAHRVARAGIARTFQTTKLFESLSTMDNVLIAMRRGHMGGLLSASAPEENRNLALALLEFTGYRGDPDTLAGALPHVDRRLVEIARALAIRPKVLMLDEPAAGLTHADKDQLKQLFRAIALLGIAVVLIEHDMPLVMGVSDHIVVLDAGRLLAEGTPAEMQTNADVRRAYLGTAGHTRRQAAVQPNSREMALTVQNLSAGYGASSVLDDLSFDVRDGEMVAILGANGAGKTTIMRVLSGLLPAPRGMINFDGRRIDNLKTHEIAALGLTLVPEGRQVFPELSVQDNLELGASTRGGKDVAADIERMTRLFPRLRERISTRAGLLSGGEQQMLAIARGLMAHPRILLLDEPSLGLAPQIIDEVFGVLSQLRDDGTTIVLADQMAALALTVADRGYVLEQGRFAQSGTAEQLAMDPELEASYLGKTHA